jgi:hypothetical protein
MLSNDPVKIVARIRRNPAATLRRHLRSTHRISWDFARHCGYPWRDLLDAIHALGLSWDDYEAEGGIPAGLIASRALRTTGIWHYYQMLAVLIEFARLFPQQNA